MRVSNTQRSLYLQCPKRYQYRYKRKMREREKGSALFFGTAFDQASDLLFHERDLGKAKEKFTEMWMAHEDNTNCKFSKSDLDTRIYSVSDISKLRASAANLKASKAKQEFDQDGDVVKLIKEIKKLRDNGYVRDLTDEEEKFLHYAHILSLLRKGGLMLEAFHRDILPHITEVISTQMKVDIKNSEGDSIIGYIDLLCKMEGYQLPNGRILTKDDLVVADVKTAGPTFWAKLDNLSNSDQLDTYLASPQIQELGETSIICYMAAAKTISKNERSFCKSCGFEKSSRHTTCNNENSEGQRCGGEWDEQVEYYSDSKIVIGERDLGEASKVYEDYDGVVRAIKNDIFYRNRESCNAYGQVCPYYSICHKSLSPEKEEKEIERWKREKGENNH